MTTPEFRDHATRRTEQPSPEEIGEIDFKQNYMKMIEELKQEVKNCHKEMEITKTKVDEMRKSLIDNLENQETARKNIRETVQDLKNEMELMKKTQIEGRLGMKNLGK